MEDPRHERWLAELHPAERNQYFAGQLLTEADFQKEQDYGRRKRQIHNRFALGPGVICGLSVTPLRTTHGNGVRVSAGLAVDQWGREIVIPADVDILPLRLLDDSDPLMPHNEPLPPVVNISVCYREVADGQQLASSVELELDADGGTVGSLVESYSLRIREGAAPDVSTSADMTVLEHVRSGRWRDALCLLAAASCQLVSADSCVVLANIAVSQDGSFAIDACGPRLIVPTNRLLLQLANSITLVATHGRRKTS